MRYFFKHGAKFRVDVSDELDRQLGSIHLKAKDVKMVVLTHLHLDHTDGLKFFPKAEILVGEYEYAHPNGNMPTTYPDWFKPNPVAYKRTVLKYSEMHFPFHLQMICFTYPHPDIQRDIVL